MRGPSSVSSPPASASARRLRCAGRPAPPGGATTSGPAGPTARTTCATSGWPGWSAASTGPAWASAARRRRPCGRRRPAWPPRAGASPASCASTAGAASPGAAPGGPRGKGARRGGLARRPGQARLRRDGPERGVVRRHHPRAHAPGPALPRRRHGCVAQDGGGVVDGPEDHRGARRRRPQDGHRPRAAGQGLHHSGHGAQHAGLLLGKAMRGNGIRPPMGPVSSPWDNAVTESPAGVIRSECVHAGTLESREQAALALFEHIERLHDRIGTHSALGWVSPAEFERIHDGKSRPKAAWDLSTQTGQIQNQGASPAAQGRCPRAEAKGQVGTPAL